MADSLELISITPWLFTIVASFCHGIAILSGFGNKRFVTNVDIPGISRKFFYKLRQTFFSTHQTARYWNWPLWASNLTASPLFDGSDTSLSGDGEYDPDEHPVDIDGYKFPRGSGGGCVKTGPFKDVQLHLGPFETEDGYADNLRPDAFRYNPRCLTRSLNNYMATTFTNQECVNRLLESKDIIDFQETLDYNPTMTGIVGIHGGGHNTIGDVMSDFFASPQDPAFTLHHGMIDRLWAMWQAGNVSRRHAMHGTSSIWNNPKTAPVTLDTVLEFGILGSPKTMRELMDPTAFNYCYRYT